MKILRLDFETYGTVDLSEVGAWNYAMHPQTEILMLGYKRPKAEHPELWQPHRRILPDDLRKDLLDPEVYISSFNSAFERYILWHKMGIIIPVKRFIDPQASARYLSMPADLGAVSEILGLPENLAKDKRGHDLIKLFCEPHIKKATKKKPEVTTRYDWNTNPEEWEQFCQYCIRDVIAEEEVSRREELLGVLPLPPLEREIWEFDQKVNDRGIPVNVEFIQKALKLAIRSKQESQENQNRITGLKNSNSVTQMLPWVRARGYTFSTLNKNTVDSVLKDPETKISDECRAALKARREASSTSYTKLIAILKRVSPDSRLRGQFIYMGSSRCGRWAGNAVQMHNLARPMVLGKSDACPDGYDFEDMDVVRDAREMVMREDYDGIKLRYLSVLLVVKSLIRTAFSTEAIL